MRLRRVAPALALGMLGLGCSLGPRRFRDLSNPAPLVRARAAQLGDNLPDAAVVPRLLDRLEDSDPVVRLTAHEELKRRTGQDFGYVPWGEPAERLRAATRWRSWWQGPRSGLANSRPMP
jgi:hypothetical protein